MGQERSPRDEWRHAQGETAMVKNASVAALVAGAGLGLAAAALTHDPAGAQVSRIDCGGERYTIQPGDTLRGIALRAYGRGAYEPIFEANNDILTSPSLLRVGQRIVIPCLDGSRRAVADPARTPAPATAPAVEAATAPTTAPQPGAVTSETRSASAAVDGTDRSSVVFRSVNGPRPTIPAPTTGSETTTVAALGAQPTATPPAPEPSVDMTDTNRAVRLLTGTDFAPFAGKRLPEGGMITEIISRALLRSTTVRDYDISWNGDWNEHLSRMLPAGTHDVAFPWFRPDCSRPAALAGEMKRRCADFAFSAPLYELEVGFYFRAGDELALASDPFLVFGKRLCRPAGSFEIDLAAEELVAPNVIRMAPATARECFAMLAAGEVDAVSVSTRVAARDIAALQLGDRVTKAEMLGSVQTLHAVALKENAAGVAFLAEIDAALSQMRENGEFDEIVARHHDVYRLASN
jgi:polar amino acid transport system substrate-binding protein